MMELPEADAPASEWGALAVSIPDWRWPISTDSAPEPDMPGLFRIGRLPWRSTRCAQFKHQWSQHDGKGKCVPDPDHWAWEGWLLRLLGEEIQRVCIRHGFGWMDEHFGDDGSTEIAWMDSINVGRACIAAAHALGRWPGGEG